MFFGVNFSFNEKHFLYSFILKCLADVEGGCARSNLCSHIIRFNGSVLCVSVLVYSLRLNYSIKSFSHSPPQLSEMRCTLTVCVCGESAHTCACVLPALGTDTEKPQNRPLHHDLSVWSRQMAIKSRAEIWSMLTVSSESPHQFLIPPPSHSLEIHSLMSFSSTGSLSRAILHLNKW